MFLSLKCHSEISILSIDYKCYVLLSANVDKCLKITAIFPHCGNCLYWWWSTSWLSTAVAESRRSLGARSRLYIHQYCIIFILSPPPHTNEYKKISILQSISSCAMQHREYSVQIHFWRCSMSVRFFKTKATIDKTKNSRTCESAECLTLTQSVTGSSCNLNMKL